MASVLAAVLLISALGLAIVFGLMGVINLAHGELMMLGAYTTFVVQNVFKLLPAPLFEFYIFFALIAAFIVAAAAGLVLERGVIRFLYGRPLETLLATWGRQPDFTTIRAEYQLVADDRDRLILSAIFRRDVTSQTPSRLRADAD